MIIAQKSDTVFGKLVVLGVGLPIVFQAFINMAVAVELFPVTGQTLPLISSGGTSIWKEIHKLLPTENIIYLADSKNAPMLAAIPVHSVDTSGLTNCIVS